MKGLRGFTPQSRGQRFNGLIAEMLQAWGIEADCGLRSYGEIDVAFASGGRHFITEAKWEATPTDTGAIAKLQKRVRQRLGGTLGLFVSMAGYSADALNELKDGEQLSVICLTRSHFEAMLAGFTPPQELLSELVRKASYQGIAHSELHELYSPTARRDFGLSFEHPEGMPDLIAESDPGFSASVVLSGLEFDPSTGIAEYVPNCLLLYMQDGLYKIDLTDKTTEPVLAFPRMSGNPLLSPDGSLYLMRGSGVARFRDNRMEVVAGGLPGCGCLSMTESGAVWAFSSGSDTPGREVAPSIMRIGRNLGDQQPSDIDYPPASAHIAAQLDDLATLVCGNKGIVLCSGTEKRDLVPWRSVPSNPGGLMRIGEERFLIAGGDVDLWELSTRNGELRKVARLRMHGSIYDLAKRSQGGGYLCSHYADASGHSRRAVAQWHMPPEA